ncbi:MAG: hypothetical protein GC181_03580 [Bacteroidetes bacterium]|nr:hypothetical protein [Bacteroidota bacterium]
MTRTQDKYPFVVFGPSKSGTTWLQKSLNQLHGITCHFQLPIFPFSKSELDKLNGNRKTMFSAFESSPFAGVFESDDKYNEYKDINNFLRKFPLNQKGFTEKFMDSDSKALNDLVKKIKQNYTSAVLDLENNPDCVGTKAYTNIGEYFKVYPNGKVICIVRNIRDVIVSKRFHNLRGGNYFIHDIKTFHVRLIGRLFGKKVLMKLFKSNIKSHLYSDEELENKGLIVTKEVIDAFGTDWIEVVDHIHKYREHPGVLIVKYEDMKTEFVKTMYSVLEHIELNPTEYKDELEAMVKQKKEFGKNSFYRSGKIGDFENHFNNSTNAYIISKSKKLMTEMNYEF